MDQQTVLDALDADDPRPALDKLADGPLAVDCPDLGSGRLVLPRYAQARRVLRDDRFGCGESAAAFLERMPDDLRPLLAPVASWTLYMDGAPHRRLRGLLSKAFTARRVAALESRVVALVGELLDGLADRGGGNAVTELAVPLPVLTISALLGLPAADQKALKNWSDDLIRIIEPAIAPAESARLAASWTALWEYFGAALKERRRHPGEDLITDLAQVEDGDGRLTDEEIVANCVSLLLGGHETTTNLHAAALLALRAHPGSVRDGAAADGAAGFVEEVLRTDGPSKITSRVALVDVDLDGVTVPRGRQVVLLLASANRDPEVFDRPHAFDPFRTPNPHLAFGFGPHACFGAALARLQGRALVRQYAAHPAGFEVCADEVRWKPSRVLRSAASLPLRVGSAA
nr:cytochrome P450 [Streptomyces sp. NBC_00886]